MPPPLKMRPSHRRVWDRLWRSPSPTNVELSHISCGYRAAISDLRKLADRFGFEIVCQRGKAGINRYVIRKRK